MEELLDVVAVGDLPGSRLPGNAFVVRAGWQHERPFLAAKELITYQNIGSEGV